MVTGGVEPPPVPLILGGAGLGNHMAATDDRSGKYTSKAPFLNPTMAIQNNIMVKEKRTCAQNRAHWKLKWHVSWSTIVTPPHNFIS